MSLWLLEKMNLKMLSISPPLYTRPLMLIISSRHRLILIGCHRFAPRGAIPAMGRNQFLIP